jgi:hypothetical protein
MAGNDKYPVYKRKPRDGYTYPIKPNILFDFLDKYEVSKIRAIAFRSQTGSKEILAASYKGEFVAKETNRTEDIGLSTVYVYSVPKDEQEKARKALMEEAIPLLCAWLRDAEHESATWRQNDHNIVLKYSKGQSYLSLDERRFY